MEVNILYSFIIAAIFQGLSLGSFILFSKKYTLKAAKFLGLTLLMVALSQLQYLLEDLELLTWHQFSMLYIPLEFLEVPFFYLFIKFYLFPKERIKKLERLLFIPFVFFLVNTISYKIVALLTGETWKINQFLNESSDLTDSYGDYVNIIMLFVVICNAYFKIRNYEKLNINYNSEQIRMEFLWLKILLFCLFIDVIFWSYYTYQYMLDENTFYLPMDLVASVIIYIGGYIGMHKLNILSERKRIRSLISEISDYQIIDQPKNEHIIRLENLVIQEKEFLNPNLTLDSLAQAMQLSKSHLSRIINTELQISFSDYINSLRVEEAKKLLLNPEFTKYTLISIGLESGFNSKTTFNNAFKKITGQTPSQFKKNNTN